MGCKQGQNRINLTLNPTVYFQTYCFPLSITLTKFGKSGSPVAIPNFQRSTLELETKLIPAIFETAMSALPEIPDCPNSEVNDAQKQWQDAYDMWMADHEKWQTAFQEYKDEL